MISFCQHVNINLSRLPSSLSTASNTRIHNKDWRVFQWSFKWISKVFKRCSMGVWGKFQGCFKEVLRLFQERLRVVPKDIEGWFNGASRVPKRSWKGVSREFQGTFIDVLFCNFVVAWISSYLPKQKEGLSYLEFGLLGKNKWMHLFLNLSPLSPISWSPSLLQNWVSVCLNNTCSDPKVVLIAHMRKRFSFLLLPHTQTQTCKQEYGSAVWLRVP